MKLLITLTVFFFLSFLVIPKAANAQDGHWVFKEIIRGNHYGSSKSPDAIQLDINEGFVEFSISQANNCTERYRFSYRFLQDMNILEIPENSKSLPVYSYEVEFEPLDPPCYPNQGYSNPYVNVTHAGASSGLKGTMQKNNTWKYKLHEEFISNHQWYAETGIGGENRHYARKAGKSLTGKVNGYFNVKGPTVGKRLDLYLKNYPSIVTDFRILFKAQSTKSKADAFYYDILLIYELKEGSAPTITQLPCDIKEPDCSCCAGTIPVWNFQSNKGDCICPEGQIWDKIQNKCIRSN